MTSTVLGMTVYSVGDAAKALGYSVSYIRRICQERRIGQKVGGQWLLTDEDVDTLREGLRRTSGNPREETSA